MQEIGLLFGGVGSCRVEGEACVEGGVGLLLEAQPERGFGLEETLIGIQGTAFFDLADLNRRGEAVAHREEGLREAMPGGWIGDDVVIPAIVPGLQFHRSRFRHAGF